MEGVRDRIVHIADLHFWRIVRNPLRMLNKRLPGNLNVIFRRSHHFLMEHAEPFADAVAASGVGQVLLTGDFTSTALDEEFEIAAAFVRGLMRRGLAVHLVPGNHDVYTFEARRAGRFERHFAEFLPPGGYPACLTLAGGTPLILVPTAVPNPFSARGRLTEADLEKAQALLDACPAGPVLVASHYPLLFRTAAYRSTWQHQLRNAGRLRDLLGASGRPILHAAGHVHRFSYVRDAAYATLAHLTTGGFFRKDAAKGVDGEFTEIQATAAGFGVVRHCYEREWTQEEVEPV